MYPVFSELISLGKHGGYLISQTSHNLWVIEEERGVDYFHYTVFLIVLDLFLIGVRAFLERMISYTC